MVIIVTWDIPEYLHLPCFRVWNAETDDAMYTITYVKMPRKVAYHSPAITPPFYNSLKIYLDKYLIYIYTNTQLTTIINKIRKKNSWFLIWASTVHSNMNEWTKKYLKSDTNPPGIGHQVSANSEWFTNFVCPFHESYTSIVNASWPKLAGIWVVGTSIPSIGAA